MKPQTSKLMLKVLLRVVGCSTLLALVPLFFPLEWMRAIHLKLGLGEAPSDPIFEYMARSLCVMYAAYGAIVLRVASNLERYWQMVPWIYGVNACIGMSLIVIDLAAPMPWQWTLCEGPSILAMAALLMWLYTISSKSQNLGKP